MSGYHTPVLLEECLGFLQVREGGRYLDGTVGGGGHSGEILRRGGRVFGTDRDADAIAAASGALSGFGDRVKLFNVRFSEAPALLDKLGVNGLDGAILDLGVSSFQLDNPSRGFSYMNDGPLDMRMSSEAAISARDVINNYTEKDLARLFWEYGEERWAKRIAAFIAEERKARPFETTFELVSCIKRAVPKAARQEGIHPAKRVFQAVRVEVNDELGGLGPAIEAIALRLNHGARLCVCDFQSLEDRIVKQTFKRLSDPCEMCEEPPRVPCKCDRQAAVKILTKKPVTPSDEELAVNHRARSTKLRVIERL